MIARTKSLPYLPTDEDIARLRAAPTSMTTKVEAAHSYRRMLLKLDQDIRGWRAHRNDAANWRRIGLHAFAVWMELRDVSSEEARAIVDRLWPA